MKFYKGEKVVAHNQSNGELYNITIPLDNMCHKMVKRYIIMQIGLPEGNYVFIKE